MAERLQQDGWIARRPVCLVETGDDRFDGVDETPDHAQVADQRCGDEGLADIGAGCGNENAAHWAGIAAAVGCARMRMRTISARRSISSSGCWAVNVRRSRAVPGGTVGGRMAVTRNPASSSSAEAASAVEAFPSTTGTIGLSGSGSQAARANALAFASGSAA